MIEALAEVMRHRLGELDKHSVATKHPLELTQLRRTRRRLVKLFALLIGRTPPNPGPK
jgi:hypothetical protein